MEEPSQEGGASTPARAVKTQPNADREHKMHQYLVGQGYWNYIKGAHEDQPVVTAPKYTTWDQVASRLMYFLATCVHDHMLGFVREMKTPKEAWEIYERFSRRTQLQEGFNFAKS